MSENKNGHVPVIASLSAARASVYQVLATLYLEPPSRALVSGLLALTGEMAELFDEQGAACLRRYARSYAGDTEPLHQEFHDLFKVPLGRYVTPYEAVYRDQRVVGETRVAGLLMGPSTLAVMATYRDSGVQVPPECGELPDHIGVELNFMALECAREQAAWKAGDEGAARVELRRQQRFLQTHLVQWVPALARRIAANARSDFYRGIALLTEAFLRRDVATLARALGN